jgi:hypothetical protein
MRRHLPPRCRAVALLEPEFARRGAATVQNRLINYLGYDNVVYFEDAPEFAGATTEAVPAPS